MERLAEEHQAVGFYLSGHPLDDYRGPLRRQRILTHAELMQRAAGGTALVARIAGSVAAREERKSARGNRFAFVRLSDPTGLYEVTVFSDVLATARDLLEPGENVVLTVEASLEGDEELRLRARSRAADRPGDRGRGGGGPAHLHQRRGRRAFARRSASRTATREARARSRGPVNLVLMHPELPGEVEIALPAAYPLTPQVISAIKHVPGVLHVEEF